MGGSPPVRLIPSLLKMVKPGGQLVVQVPSNFRHITQTLVRDMAGELPFRESLGGWSRMPPVLTIDEYADLLYANGGEEMTVYEKVYPHILQDLDALAEWHCMPCLLYFERLSPDMKDKFMGEYKKRLRAYYPSSPVFFGFRRTLFAASRRK